MQDIQNEIPPQLYYNDGKTTKNICCMKDAVNKWLKKLGSGCKKLDKPATLVMSTTVDSEAVFQAIEASCS